MRGFFLLLMLLVAAGSGAVLLRVEIVNRIAPWYLARAFGVPVEFVLREIDARSARVERLAVGSGRQLVIENVLLDFDAVAGRLQGIEIGRLDLMASYGTSLSLGELEPVLDRLRALAGNGEDAAPEPDMTGAKMPRIVVRDIELAIDTRAGPITGSGTLTIENAAVTASFTLSEEDDRARVAIRLAAPFLPAALLEKAPTGEVTARISAASALWSLAGLRAPSGGNLELMAELKPAPATGEAGRALALANWSARATDLGYPGLAAPLSGVLRGIATYGENWLELTNVDGKIEGGALAGLALTLAGTFRIDDQGGSQSLRGTLQLDGAAAEFAHAGYRLKKPRAVLDLAFSGRRDNSGALSLDLGLQKAGTFSSQRIEAGAAGTIAKPTSLAIRPGKATYAHVSADPVAGIAVNFSVALGKAALVVEPNAPNGRLLMALPSAVVTGHIAPGTPAAFGFDTAHMQVGVPDRGLTLGDVTLSLVAADRGLSARFSTGALAGLGKFLPVKAAGDANLADGILRFSGHFSGIDQPLDLGLGGSVDLAKGSGSVDVMLAPIVFAPGKLQPYNLFPPLRDYFDDVSGQIELKGPVTFSGGRLTSALKLGVAGFSGKVGPVQLTNVNSVVEIDSPWPFSTRPDQTVAVELADIGLPLRDALFRFKVSDGKRLDLAESQLAMAGGKVSLDPTTLAFDAPVQQLRLRVEALSVAQLFGALGIAGLSGEGSISGEVPVTIFPGGIAIPSAKLQATAPGVLRYDRNQAPLALQGAGESVALALEALADFHYEKLILDLTRNLTGDVILGLHIAGRNPSFYDGYPVEFNLTVEGRLDQAVREGLAGYQVPDMIQQQLNKLSP